MVSEIRMHVGVVDTVIKAGIGDGDNHTASIQTGPRRVNVGHVGGVPGVINVHHLNAYGVKEFKERSWFDPLNSVLLNQPREPFNGQGHRSEPSRVGVQSDVAALKQTFGKVLARKDHVDHGAFIIHKRVGGVHVQVEHASCEIGLHFIR